jgi:hypothetical protein
VPISIKGGPDRGRFALGSFTFHPRMCTHKLAEKLFALVGAITSTPVPSARVLQRDEGTFVP